jgi:hypothetical protein
VKQVWNVLAMAGLTVAALALGTIADPETVRPVAVWTARMTLILFVTGFVLLGLGSGTGTRKLACRAAAFVMGLHLLALLRLAQLVGVAPLSFASVSKAVTSLGGVAAMAIVLAGWLCWDRRWYRWAVYWPWGVFLFTYVFLSRHGDAAARVRAAPLSFGPIAVLLLVALGWRLGADLKRVMRKRVNASVQMTSGSATKTTPK